MLNFILNNIIFDFTIGLLVIINFILTAIIDYKQTKSSFKDFKNLDNISKTKITLIFLSLILSAIFLYIKHNNLVSLIIYFIVPIVLLIKTIFDIYTNKKSLSTDDKFRRLWAAYLFIIFFSSRASEIYYSTFLNINHIIKEILLLFYLLTKLVLFVFLLLINISILISNINTLKPLKPLKEKNKQNNYRLIDYNFLLYRKFNLKILFFIDFFIYFLFAIPTITLNVIAILYLKLIGKIKEFINYLLKKLILFSNESNKIIRKITNISIIISFSIVYIITIVYKTVFSNEVLEAYDFLSTVILIPFIYDSIKSK